MEPTIYKPGANKTPGVYKGAGGIYNGRGVYNDGAGGDDVKEIEIGGDVYKYRLMPDGKKWLLENLDYIYKVSGTPIPTSSATLTDNRRGAYMYNDAATYGKNGIYKCGLLYNFAAVKYLADNNTELLPTGWRVPIKEDYDRLITSCGGEDIAGKLLKAVDNSIISGFPQNWNGDDKYKFKSLPSGSYYGSFEFGTYNNFWTRTQTDSTKAVYFYMNNTDKFLYYSASQQYMRSLRLICD